jgi:hypothetical protein
MPGTVRNLQEPFPPLLPAAGHSPSSPLERSCAALARSADSINQHAKHVAEAAEGARAAAAKCKAIREALVAKHG